MATVDPQLELTKLLHDAADDRPGAVEAFFELLLRSKVYVPLRADVRAGETIARAQVPILGDSSIGELGFLTVTHEGKETLPIFTEQSFVAEWAEREIPSEAKEFKSLIWLVGDDVSLYLNAAQDVGKELTPWEVVQLRRGVEAIPDLVEALGEDTDEEISVRPGDDVFPELVRAVRPILEIYAELREAFLAAVSDYEGADERPVIGIRYEKITDAKRVYVRSELEAISRDILPSHQRLMVLDDLGDKFSPNAGMFQGMTPFYFAQKAPPPSSPAKGLFKLLGGGAKKR